MRFTALMVTLCCCCCCCTFAATHQQCQLRPTNFEGWKAEELSNDWVLLTIVPQLGGRLMQVTFAGHSYLFVNPQYKGQYFPPSGKNNGKWFNYGGDKLWPLPEGRQDEQHWAGPASDPLDDGEYQLMVVSHTAIFARNQHRQRFTANFISRCDEECHRPSDPLVRAIGNAI